MSFRLDFETCNAAFGEPGDSVQFRTEVKRVLRRVIGLVEAGADEGPVMDINGNKVGSWALDYGCRCQPTDEHAGQVQAHDGTWWPAKGVK